MSEFWEQHYPRAWGSWILYPNCLAYLVCLSDTELPPSDLGISRQIFQRAWGWGRGSHVGSAPTRTKRLTELSLCKWYTALANYQVVESFRVRQTWGSNSPSTACQRWDPAEVVAEIWLFGFKSSFYHLGTRWPGQFVSLSVTCFPRGDITHLLGLLEQSGENSW